MILFFRNFPAVFQARLLRFFLCLSLFLFGLKSAISQSFPGDCQAGLSPCSYNNGSGQFISDIPFNDDNGYADLFSGFNSVNCSVDSGEVYLFKLDMTGNYLNPKLSLFRLPEFDQPVLICSNTSEIRWLANFTGVISVQVNEPDCEVRFHQDFDPLPRIKYRKFSNPLVNCNTGNQAQLSYGCGTNAQGQQFFEYTLVTQDLVSDSLFIPDTMEVFYKRSNEAETVSSWVSGRKVAGVPASDFISGQIYYNRRFESGPVFGIFNSVGYDFRYRFICNGLPGPMSDVSTQVIYCSPCLNSVAIQSVDASACSSIKITSPAISGSSGIPTADFFKVYYKKIGEPESTETWVSSDEYGTIISGDFPDFIWNVAIPSLEAGASYMVKWQPGCLGGFLGNMSPVFFFSEDTCKINISAVDVSLCQSINLSTDALPASEPNRVDSLLVCYREINEPETVPTWLSGKKYLNNSFFSSGGPCKVSLPSLEPGRNYLVKVRPEFPGFTAEFSDVFQFQEDSCKLTLNCPDEAYTGAGATITWDGPPNVSYNLDYSEKKTGPWKFVASDIPVLFHVQVPIPKHSSKKIQSTLYNRVSVVGNPSQFSIDSMLVTNTALTFLGASTTFNDPSSLDLDKLAGRVQKIWAESLPTEIYLNSRGAFAEGFPGEGSITIEGRITTSQGGSIILSNPEPFASGTPVGYSNNFFVSTPVIEFYGSTISGPTNGVGQVIDRDTFTVFLKSRVIQSPVSGEVASCFSPGSFQVNYYGAQQTDQYKFSSDGGQSWTPIVRQGAITPDPVENGLSSVNFIAPAVNSSRCRLMVIGEDTTAYNFTIINAAPSVSAIGGSSTFCQNGSLKAEGAGSFLWYKDGILLEGKNSGILEVSQSGVYSVQSVLDACTSSVSSGISVTVLPRPVASVISAQGSTDFCQGGSVTLSGNAGGTWSNGQNTSVITITEAGNYFITNSNSCGSINSDTITVNVYPSVGINSISPAAVSNICSESPAPELTGNSGSGGNGSYQYTWESSLTSASGPFTAIPDQSGANYFPGILSQNTWFRRVIKSGDCPASFSNTAEVSLSFPILNNLIQNNSQSLCQSEVPAQIQASIPQGGNGTFAYQWEYAVSASGPFTVLNNAVSQNYQAPALQASTWFRRRVSSGFCPSVYSDTAAILINPLPTASVIQATGSLSFCSGDSVVLTGNNNGGVWNTGQNTTSIKANISGTYFVTNTNNCGTVNSNTIQVDVLPVPSSEFSFNLIGTEVTLSYQSFGIQFDSLRWDFGDGQTSSEFNPIHLYDNSGNYSICLRSYLGACSSVSCKPVQITVTGNSAGLYSAVQVIPNPGIGIFEIKSSEALTGEIRVLDIRGSLVFASPAKDNNGRVILDLRAMPAGSYILEILLPTGPKRIRLMKE